MDLVERDQELTELTRMLAEVADGRGNAAIIHSAIGCGKTELLNALKTRAADAGFLVLGAVGSWAERESRGGVLNQLHRYAEVPLVSTDTVEMLERVCRTHAVDPAVGDPGVNDRKALDWDATVALHRLCMDVLRVAERVPVLLCIDDVQFIDALSRHWLLHMLSRVRSARIAVVLTECNLSKPLDVRIRSGLLRLPNYRRLTLRRLSEDGVAALLARHLGGHPADDPAHLAAECHAISGGNPLLVRAMIEDHEQAGASSRITVADAYADAVLNCLLRGRPILLRLGQALAVLDEDAEVGGLVTRLLDDNDDSDTSTVERGLVALDAAGLLDGRRIRHAVARDAILASIAPYARAALHERAAELLYAEGASATRVARHLLAADRIGQPWAVPVLREAAERHLADNSAAQAHACLEAALRLCTDESERMVLRALYASAAWLLNPSISARHFGELTAALREGRLPDRHALVLAKFLLWHGRFDDAADAIERIGERAADAPPAGLAEIRAARELLASSYPSLVSSETVRLGGGPVAFGRDGDPRVRAAAALSDIFRQGPNDAAVAAAESAMRAMRLGKRTQEWLMCGVAALQFADRIGAAASWCDHWLEGSRSRHVPLWEAEFSSLRAAIALRQGDPVLARQLAEAALAQVPAESWGVCIGGPLANLIQAATETGDYDAAAAYLELPAPEGLLLTRFGLYYLHARGRYHLEIGRPYAALDDFTACGELMAEWGFDQPSLVPWRSEAARAHLMLDDPHRAAVLAREQLAMAGTRPTRTRALSLRALAAVSGTAEQGELLTEAVQILQSCGDRLQLAGALADLGRLHLETGRRTRGRPMIDMAARLAERCGAGPLLRSLPTDGTTRQAGATTTVTVDPAAALILLSGAERRVAMLAACGHTNRQISQKLNITVSTVEQHLTRVFRKLGVKARRDLPEEIVLERRREPNRYQQLTASGEGR